MKRLTTIFLVMLFTALMGCSSEKTYQVQLSNNTPYDFEGIELQMGNESQRIALKSMEKSKIIAVSYTTSWANLFGPGSLGFASNSYSLNGVTFPPPTYGNVIMRNDLGEQLVNQIVLEEIDSEDGTLEFRYALQ